MTQQLSPAAQAVLDAHDNAPYENFVAADRLAVAAALRAAADQVVPLYICSITSTRGQTRLGVRHKFLAIAAELDGATTTSENVLDS